MGVAPDDYTAFKFLNQRVIKPAVKEINQLTNFFVAVEQKREGRRIGFLKFRISRLKELPSVEPTQASLFPDIEDLPAVANVLVQAGVTRREALKIANKEWKAVDTDLNRGGLSRFSGIRRGENRACETGDGCEKPCRLYRQSHPGKLSGSRLPSATSGNANREKKEQMLDALKSEMLEKRNALLRQAVRADPELLVQASHRIQAHIVRERLERSNSVQEAYRDGGMVTAEINAILAEELCTDLLAPLYEVYETEKARILEQ